MPTDSRAASATRARVAANGTAVRRPVKQLSNKPAAGGGSWAVKIIALSVLAVAVNFAWKKFKAYEKAQNLQAPARAATITPLALPASPVVAEMPKREEPRPAKQAAKKKRRALTIEEQIQMEVEREQVEDTRAKPDLDNPELIAKLKAEHAELVKAREERLKKRLADHLAARAEVAAKIKSARSDGAFKSLAEFRGIKFGDEIKGVASQWGGIHEPGEADARGVTYAVYAADVKDGIGTLARSPLVWVTPGTKRAFKVEFSRPLKLLPRAKHDAETPKLVEALQKELKREAFALRASDEAVMGAEYVFPLSDTTVKVCEEGGRLKVVAINEPLRRLALEEALSLHDAKAADQSADDLLAFSGYPQGPAVNYRSLAGRFREGTPKSFCGLTFGRMPAESAVIVNPKHGEKGYYLDYRRDKCKAFKGFNYGKADIDPYRGGLYGVTLYNSDGGEAGLYDKDFFQSVKASLSRQYLVEPKEEPGTREYPKLVYEKGDVTITFEPDRNGGFKLSALHGTLADIARIPVKEPAKKSRR